MSWAAEQGKGHQLQRCRKEPKRQRTWEHWVPRAQLTAQSVRSRERREGEGTTAEQVGKAPDPGPNP